MNRVAIEPTEFINVRSGDKSYGYRIFDDYSAHYDNNLELIPDDDFDLLKIIIKSQDKNIQDIVSFIKEEKKGVYVGNVWYDFEKIENLLKGDFEKSHG